MTLTTDRTIVRGATGIGGYRTLQYGAGESHLPGADPVGGRSLMCVAHLSDIHVCDAQSPARVEFLDRWADPDSPILDQLGEVGVYRAQEILTAQVAEAMVRAVNEVRAGPVSGRPVDLAIVTGDNTDNAQLNELAWYLALLDGGTVAPDSGDQNRYEGVADADVADERIWHPDAMTPDLPRERWGFPTVPGLLDAVRAPFAAGGLATPWLAVHGNHDRLLQGTLPAVGPLAAAATSARKSVALPAFYSPEDALALLAGLEACDPKAMAALGDAVYRRVTPDASRRIVSRAEFVRAHFSAAARPPGHGFRAESMPYYRHDLGAVTFLTMDTVNAHGGWQGSLDEVQLAWLVDELCRADGEQRYVVLASHHPLSTLINDTHEAGAPRRVLAAELAAVIAAHPSVVLWLNGHTHQTTITSHRTFWEVTAPSLIDWPQQARVVELLLGEATLTVAVTMVDHQGAAPWDGATDGPVSLAGLSRELAANDWQWAGFGLEEHPRAGRPEDRNVLLRLRDPWVGTHIELQDQDVKPPSTA
jgi:metallophosphoesterase (TIGR03767 family)